MDPGVRENKARQLPPRPRRGRGRGAHLCGPPPARDSLQSPRNLSALRMGQRCVEKGSAEAASSRSSPSGSPTRAPAPCSTPPSACAPRLPPSRTGRAAARPLEQTCHSVPAPLGRNLGPLGLEAASHSRSWSPGASRASEPPGARNRESWPALERRPRGHGENLPQCLEQRLQRGWRRRTP